MMKLSPLSRALTLACALSLPLVAQALPMAGNTPDVFSLGVGNSPIGGTSRHADMPVAYRYQYFTGGLGANDWRNWNSPDGAFADQWLSESRSAGLTPVVTYYNIVPAAPFAYQEPPLGNLQTPATMKAYYENWIFLMQRIAAFGDPVVVHVEPDLFGYFQWTNPDPKQTTVSVASSGLPAAAGYENNPSGFAKLLVALRDQYAPNVILGWHASAWATRTDLILNQGDPNVLALATADFYRKLGANFDVMFSEFSDRDSGFYQVNGQPQRWWKPEDFDRFRQFIGRLSQEVDQDVVLWQVPVGNTLYTSMDNTSGHYQDNRAEYFLKSVVDQGDTTHLRQYRDAGVVALLFGAGEDTQTRYFDSQNNGPYTGAQIDNRQYNHTDHLNSLAPINADDDGGFLRKGIQTYYANGPLPLVDSQVPACSDGLDNDNDGLIDMADPGCASPGDSSEFNPAPVPELPATLTISADWGSGYCADVAVTNTTTGLLEWKTRFTITGTITSLWNAVYAQNGDEVKASGVEWNKNLAAGATANFGFCASRPVTAPKAACADGLDNDGNGLIDFPADPGCSSADDNAEDAPGTSLPLNTTLTIDGDWGSGYCATVTIANPGQNEQTWNVSLPIEGQVTNLWNAIHQQSGNILNAHGYDWNKTVPANGSREFGFCAAR